MKFVLRTLDDYSAEALILEIRRVAESLNGKRLTRARFDSLGRVHSSTLSKRFGSWQAALDKAEISELIAPRQKLLSRERVIQALRQFAMENPGVPVNQKTIAKQLGNHASTLGGRYGKWKNLLSEVGLTPVPLGRRYTENECFENILDLWTHYGRQPHFGELKYPPSRVGPKAYILRWGGWRKALSAFVKQVNQPAELSFQKDSIEPSLLRQSVSSFVSHEPRSISLALRYRILVRDKFRCVICGASPAKNIGVELHVDHIQPWSRGGKNIEENLRTLCSRCNLGKGDKLEIADPPSA